MKKENPVQFKNKVLFLLQSKQEKNNNLVNGKALTESKLDTFV